MRNFEPNKEYDPTERTVDLPAFRIDRTEITNAALAVFASMEEVTGLAAPAVLQNNGKDDLPVSTNGTFAFSTRLAPGQPYNVNAAHVCGEAFFASSSCVWRKAAAAERCSLSRC